MPIKSILCVYGGERHEAAALEAACRLAVRVKAELRILHPMAPVAVYPDLYGVDVASLEKESLARADHAEKTARDAALGLGMAFYREADRGPDAVQPHAVFAAVTGYVNDLVPAAGRACDLIIAGRDDMDVSSDIDAILAALLDTCTPTLVVPRGAEAAFDFADPGQTVALAWDGSAAAGRALRGLDLVLAPGQAVDLICVRPKRNEPLICPADGAVRWAELHGYVPRVVNSGPFAMSDGEAILINVRQREADLLVMGAYGHSHWREMLLGGATDHILKHGDLPLLLCH